MNWLLLKNSLLVAGLTTLLSLSFGSLAALWLAGLETRWRRLFFAAAILALALPPFLVTNCWLHYLGLNGVWRSWLPLNLFSPIGAAGILSLMLWPVTLLAAWSAWQRLQPAQLESDPALTGFWLLRGLLLPVAGTAFAQAAAITFVLALNNFAVPAILQVKVFPAEMWIRFNTAFDTVGALAMSWPLVAGPLMLMLWCLRREMPWPSLQPPVPPRLFRQQLGRGWFRSCGAATLLLCLFSVGLPAWQLVSTPRTWLELPDALAAGHAAIWHSFGLAAAAAALVVIVAVACAPGAPGGWPRTPLARCGESIFAWLLWLPFLLPGVLLGIALIFLFNRRWTALLYEGAGIVILALAIRYLAFGWHTVRHALGKTDRDLADVARLEGADHWQMFRLVHWPQIAPQVLAAAYIVFLLCLWDVESMILVVPPGGETLALRIFNLLHYGHNAHVNALCVTLLALALVPWLLWQTGRWLSIAWSGSARGTLRCVGLCLPFLLLAGCGPEPQAGETPLASQIFRAVRIIGQRGTGAGELNKPRSVAVDAQDNLFVVDMTGRVQKFSPAGRFLLSWQMPETDLGRAKGMCRDREGNIVVIEPHYSRVNHFTPNGQLAAQWGRHGTNAGELGFPRAAAVNSHAEIVLSEYGVTERVQRFRLRPAAAQTNQPAPGQPQPLCVEFLNALGRMGRGPSEFNRPEGLCVDEQDRIYIADSCNHRVQVFSREGQFLRAYGRAGSGPGELSYPYDICVDPTGRQYVCEFGNSRIQVFDAQDRPLEIIGGPGAAPGRFSNPWGVALDSAGNLYVADSQNHRVQKLLRK